MSPSSFLAGYDFY
ncbi:hypothetical protein FWK35_00034144 [Aphis craccivora]|uniref:Uncharacterized protein n=1 Tax=Aphis craccivora TaxID=307492 RepID=A0A6G0YRZ2_APHCR|nr:hypothetical protein FWK35_00034144 [Aphis craccivora]